MKVQEINMHRDRKWPPGVANRGTPAFGSDISPFTAQGLMPCILHIEAGDCLLFDSRTFHGGCAAEDPTGASSNGIRQLLRAIYVLNMAPTAQLALGVKVILNPPCIFR